MTTTIKDQTRWRSRSRIELAQVGFWMFVMLLLLLPMERVAWPMGTAPADIALVAIIALFWPIAWARRRRVAFPLLLPMWLIFVASSLAALFSPVPTIGIQTIIQEAYIYLGFVSAANLLAWLDEENMHRLNKIWIIIACLEGLLSLMGALKIGPSFLYESPIPLRPHYEFEGIQRAFATFANPNAAAAYLMTAFFVFMATPWPRHPLLRLAVGAWLFLGIYATGSNAALGGTLAGLGFYFLYWLLTQEDRQAVRMWIALGTLMAAVVIAPLLVGFSYSSLLSPSVAKSDLLATTVGRVGAGVERRTNLLGIGWEFFSHNLLGVGPAGVSAIFGVGLHNDYMAFLAERGGLGLIGFLLLITLTMACVLASARLAHGDRVRQLQATALGVGFLADCIDAMAHEVFHSRFLWFLMAVIFAYYYMLRQRVGQVAGMESDMSITSLGKDP